VITPVSSKQVSTPISLTLVTATSTTRSDTSALRSVTSTLRSVTSTSDSTSISTPAPIKKEATNIAQYTATSADLEVIGSDTCKSLQFSVVLKEIGVKYHVVNGDGSCLYHAIAHQAGFISKSSRGDVRISYQLCQLALNMMTKYSAIRTEDDLTVEKWLEEKLTIIQSSEWGGDLELWLLAIGIQRDIVVIISDYHNSYYARKFPCQPPPLPKMKGGIFIPLTGKELCKLWKSITPSPLVVSYNGQNNYNSTLLKCNCNGACM